MFFLGFGWRDVANRAEKSAVVEPVDPFEGREFHSFRRAPRPATPDHLSLQETVDAFCKGVVIAVAGAADGGFDTGFNKPRGVGDRYILAASIAVVSELS